MLPSTSLLWSVPSTSSFLLSPSSNVQKLPWKLCGKKLGKRGKELTTDARRIFENFIQLRIHLDVHIATFRELLCSLIHLLVHPNFEVISTDCENHICDVAPVETFDFSFFHWKVIEDLWKLFCPFQHFRNTQRFKEWYVYVSHFFAFQVSPRSVQNAFHEVAVHDLVIVKVNSGLSR